MKIGEKVICVKDYGRFYKGEILFLRDIICSYDKRYTEIKLSDLNNNYSHIIYLESFSTLFITSKQLRKNKLNKINESSLCK